MSGKVLQVGVASSHDFADHIIIGALVKVKGEGCHALQGQEFGVRDGECRGAAPVWQQGRSR